MPDRPIPSAHAPSTDALIAALPEQNPNPVLRIASDLTVHYANASALSLFVALGLSRGAVAPRELADPARRAMLEGQRLWTELSCREHVFSLDFVPASDGVNVYAHDITDRKRAEEAIREQDRKYRQLFDQSMNAIYVTRQNGAIVDANAAACRLHGMTLEEIKRHGRAGLVVPDERLAALLNERAATGHAKGELTHRRKDGTTVPVEVESVTIDPSRLDWTSFVIARDVTDRKRAEAASARVHEMLMRLFERLPVMITTYAPRLGEFRFNDEFRRVLGWTEEDAAAGDLMALAYPDPAIRAEASAYIASLAPGWREFPVTAKDGSVIPSAWANLRLSDDTQVGIGLDLRDRKRAEEAQASQIAALRESEERLRLTLKYASAGVWEWDVETGRVLWSPENYLLYGVDPADALDFARWERCLHPDDLAATHAAIRDAMEGRTDEYRSEFRVLHPERGTRWVLGIGQIERGSDGRARRFLGLNLDITDEKRAEEALRDREEKLRLAKAAANMGAWDWNLVTGDLEWTDRCKALFGLPSDAAVSYEIFQSRIHPDDVEPIERKVREVLATGKDYDTVMRVPWADGSTRWVAAKGRAFFDAQGRAVRLLGMALDITDRKRSEEQLHHANEALREADRRKDEFLGMLSHELRNPLAPIRNSAYILQHAGPESEQARRARDVIQRQADHLTRLVDDLLDVTRIARGKVELRRSRVDLRELVRRSVDDSFSVMEERGIEIGTELWDGRLWIDADATRVSQVLGNLLHNAAKFTRRGGRVRVSVRGVGMWAEVRVRDTGSGIDPQLLPHIFDPFVQGARALARTEGGLGLGLALVKGITELHGGTVQGASAGKGQGAEFVVRLPLVEEATVMDERRASAAPTSVKRRVLIVDDNADAAQSLADIVEMMGHEPEVALDGPSALAKLEARPPDVVLCDIGLPGMSGYEVAQAIRAAGNRVQLFAVTGYAQPEDAKKAAEAGFDGHFAKPVDIAQLERLLA